MLNTQIVIKETKMNSIIAYNKEKAAKHGWDPSWFGCTLFNEELVQAIKKFQADHGLTADGMCGAGTFRALWTEREQNLPDSVDTVQFGEYIIYNGKQVPIFWDKVITWNEKGGSKASEGKYSSYSGKAPRQPRFFVTHWDVCLNSSSCFRVLEQRGISIHFGLDNDGTIFQWADLQHATWHAGGKAWNHNSVGVEISNAYDLKYQDWYKKRGLPARPVVSDAVCHGNKLAPFTGFYPVQIEALAALWEAVSFACDIPLELPKTKNAVDPSCEANTFAGFCNHYHLTTRKIDCAGLDNELVLAKAKELRKRR